MKIHIKMRRMTQMKVYKNIGPVPLSADPVILSFFSTTSTVLIDFFTLFFSKHSFSTQYITRTRSDSKDSSLGRLMIESLVSFSIDDIHQMALNSVSYTYKHTLKKPKQRQIYDPYYLKRHKNMRPSKRTGLQEQILVML